MAPQLPTDRESLIRHVLALGITILSLIGVVVLAVVIITSKTEQPQANLVLTSVLPLIGTWVGTVLAFYFSKASLETATQSVATIARQLSPEDKLKSKPVKEAMIARAQMHIEQPGFNLRAALTWLTAENRGRVPVLDANDLPQFVVHRSVIDQFLAKNALAAHPVDPNTLTLTELLADTDLGPQIRDSFGLVAENATLGDAKTSMDASQFRQDVFITKTGMRTEPVLGWITNIILEDNSRV